MAPKAKITRHDGYLSMQNGPNIITELWDDNSYYEGSCTPDGLRHGGGLFDSGNGTMYSG